MPEVTVDSREQGIEFGQLAADLENENYPLSHEELLRKYGDRELELPNGSQTVGEVLVPENEQEYQDADAALQAIFTMVGDEAVGREGYSDRGGGTPGPGTDSDAADSSDDAESM